MLIAASLTAPFLPPGPERFQRGSRGLLVISWCLVGVLVIGILGYVVVEATLASIGQQIGQGIGNGLALMEDGAYQASTVASFAHVEGISDGQVTFQDLHYYFPYRLWLSSTAPSTQRQEVSVETAGDHVITAVLVSPSLCVYGLDVGSPTDPVVALDGLAGAGTYFDLIPPESSWTCSAIDAPTLKWNPASPGMMKIDATLDKPPIGR